MGTLYIGLDVHKLSIAVSIAEDAQRQLGNAVPSLLAEVLAREITHQLLGQDASDTLELAVDAAQAPPPRPPAAKPVPSEFLPLKGEHVPHPGTGLGRALARKPVSKQIAAE